MSLPPPRRHADRRAPITVPPVPSPPRISVASRRLRSNSLIGGVRRDARWSITTRWREAADAGYAPELAAADRGRPPVPANDSLAQLVRLQRLRAVVPAGHAVP